MEFIRVRVGVRVRMRIRARVEVRVGVRVSIRVSVRVYVGFSILGGGFYTPSKCSSEDEIIALVVPWEGNLKFPKEKALLTNLRQTYTCLKNIKIKQYNTY